MDQFQLPTPQAPSSTNGDLGSADHRGPPLEPANAQDLQNNPVPPQLNIPIPQLGQTMISPVPPASQGAPMSAASSGMQGEMNPAMNPMISQSMTQSLAPANADDVDLIEKEWVVKAKEIVDMTSQDPYLQTKEINKLKAEYIKKRYNKEVKVG